MNDHLRSLLLDEAERLPIPQAPIGAVLAGGKRRVRRRRATLAGAAAAVVLVASVGLGAVAQAHGRHHGAVALDPATAPAASDWAVAQGSTIHLGTGATAKVPGQVKAMYYTSAGTLVRVGASPYTDAPDSNYWLAKPDGSLSDFKLSLGDRVPGTDPTLPYLAYATQGADKSHWTLVIRDVRDGSTVREIPFSGAFTWGGWVAPPVSLSGDHVYVGVDGRLLDIEWRTGTVHTTTIPTHMPETRAGREIVSYDKEGKVQVVDLVSGRVIKTIRYDPSVGLDGAQALSSDGRYLLEVPEATCTQKGACSYDGMPTRIIDLASGTTQQTALGYGAFGWSATGRLLIVDGRTVKSCDPDTLACTTTPVTLGGSGPLRVSGNDNES